MKSMQLQWSSLPYICYVFNMRNFIEFQKEAYILHRSLHEKFIIKSKILEKSFYFLHFNLRPNDMWEYFG